MANGKTQKVRGILMRVFLNWLIFKQITSTKNKVAYLLLSSPVLETWGLNSSFDESPTS